MTEISLIVCTRDRADMLERCLRSVSDSDVRRENAELVIVDNASTDDTADVIERFSSRAYFPVVTVHESSVGLSNARNAGVTSCKGRIVAFTDDDCYLEKDYFAAIREAFEDKTLGYLGGRILLYDPTDAPYSVCYRQERALIPPRSFVPAGMVQGANMAFRREVIEAVGRFDPRLGAGTPYRCEDVDYIARASYAGLLGAHVPEVVVYHHHGRKAGPAIEELKRANDFARGAFYMRRLLARDWKYFGGWLRVTWRNRNHKLSTELAGAWSYWRACRGGSAPIDR